MIKIDITMTAVIRPTILEETLNKIFEHVCHGDSSNFRLIINIDPIGENTKPMKIIKIAEMKFSNIIYNIPKTPSFPKAVLWVWKQATAPFIFHWEDDVNILRSIDIENMITILNTHDDLSSLRLYKADVPLKKSFDTFSCKWRYNKDGFFIADDWKKQFGLNPILIKKEFVEEAILRMRDDYNPEKQFRYSQEYMRPLIKKWKYGIYAKPGDKRLIDGRKGQRWKDVYGLNKPVGKTFVEWEKKSE